MATHEFDLDKTISFGENIQSAHLRTIITCFYQVMDLYGLDE